MESIKLNLQVGVLGKRLDAPGMAAPGMAAPGMAAPGMAAQRLAGKGEGRRVYAARFMKAGKVLASDGSEMDIEILPRALETAAGAGMYEGCAVFVDHAAFFENPSLERLVGVTQRTGFDAQELVANWQSAWPRTPKR